MFDITNEAVALIKEFEGLRLKSYQDSAGVWTIGYGTTSRAGIGVSVGPGMVITEAEAEHYLRAALEKFSETIKPGFTTAPTDNQYGAMLSLAYNIGPGAFLRSTCLKRFNAGDIDGAAEALTWFNKSGGKVLRGLVRRREAERDMFLATDPVANITPDEPKDSPAKSTSIWATITAALSGGGGVAMVIPQLSPAAQIALIVLAGIGALSLMWIAKERIRKMLDGSDV